MIYLASPYSHPDAQVREQRFKETKHFVASHIKDYLLFSPIVYLHEIALDYDFPKDAEFWKAFNLSILRRCERVWVLKLIGWDLSKGVDLEVKFAEGCFIPVEFIEWPA